MKSLPNCEDRFTTRPLAHGRLLQLALPPHTFVVAGWSDSRLPLAAGATHFGLVLEGEAALDGDAGAFALRPEMYFSLPGGGAVGGPGRGLVISQRDYRGLFHLGGPLEPTGRLRYIDGCTDTLLVPPVVRGDACLNHLVIPPGTDQTSHTHPSFRVGLIVAGRGACRTPAGATPLEAGMLFVLPPDCVHSFHTRESSLTLVAFHPDSEHGPAHDDHPMLNRTLVEGLSASRRGEPDQ